MLINVFFWCFIISVSIFLLLFYSLFIISFFIPLNHHTSIIRHNPLAEPGVVLGDSYEYERRWRERL